MNLAPKRSFHAPKGYRRLTINLREDIHKKLRQAAIDDNSTATSIVEQLLHKKLFDCNHPVEKDSIPISAFVGAILFVAFLIGYFYLLDAAGF